MLKATSVVQVKSERVLVTEWRFAPGAQTGHHVHAHDYVVVPLTNGRLRLLRPPGGRFAQRRQSERARVSLRRNRTAVTGCQ
jgi:hypothetical protein